MTVEIEDVLALSPLQEGMFSLAGLAEGEVDVYTMQFMVDVEGPLDVARLRRSVDAIMDRHPNLRASFWDQDLPQPVQIVPTTVNVPWSEHTITDGDFDAFAAADRLRPFDLAHGPALRVALLSGGEGTRRLVITAHHIVMDGWAVAVFFRELVEIYRAGGSADGLAPVRPYRDYIGWLAAQDREAALATWRSQLASLRGPLMLAERAVPTGQVPQRTRADLSVADTARLVEWARSCGLTVNTTLQFAWSIVLSRLTDRRDVVFGTTVAGRPEALSGVETMIGLFINAVPVAANLDGSATVRELCVRMQRESAALRDNGYLSLSAIQRAVGHGALFDTFLTFENAPISDAIAAVDVGDGVRLRPADMESFAHYPLTVVAYLEAGRLALMVEMLPDALPWLPADELLERLTTVLRSLPDAADSSPDTLEILLPWEGRGLGAGGLGVPARQRQPRSVLDLVTLFHRQVEATPDALALTTNTEKYTYRQLHERVELLAGDLAARGVGADDVVAVALPRSADFVIAMLATLRCGAAYTPIDVTAPQARIDSILRQANPVHILTDVNVDVAHPPPPAHIRLDQRAYLIFTSGSTGEPKGVMGTHRALAAYFADHHRRVYQAARARLGRPLRIAHAWSLSFDASWQPLVGLFDGHAIHLFDDAAMRDADQLAAGILANQLDMIDTTPTLFAQLTHALSALGERSPLSVLALGGEAIGPRLWHDLRSLAPDVAVYNCYGPTETTVEAVVADVHGSSAPTIGTPNTDIAASVLDSRLQVVPTGVIGELYLTGPQLTRGYVGAPGLTAAAFVADPERPGQRMYRTGDLVRRRRSGDLTYHGRADGQVKIRGYRIEVGEIEAVLRDSPEVAAAAVAVLTGSAEGHLRSNGWAEGHLRSNSSTEGHLQPKTLVACVTPTGAHVDPLRLRGWLAERLPGYMVPAQIQVRTSLPLTNNGKLDVDAIAATFAMEDTAAEPPTTDTERILVELFSETLGVEKLGVTRDVVALGADSITAIAVVSRARSRGVPITPRMVMRHSTIRDLAAAVDAAPLVTVAESDADRYGVVEPPAIAREYRAVGSLRRMVQIQAVTVPADVTRADLESVLQAVLDCHDMLRLIEHGPERTLTTRPPGAVTAADTIQVIDTDGDEVFAVEAAAAVDRIDPTVGSMLQAVWFRRRSRLLLVIHHYAVDVVSWHILLADLAEAWRQLRAGVHPVLPVPITSYRRWSQQMTERAAAGAAEDQRPFWQRQLDGPDPLLGSRALDPVSDRAAATRLHGVTTPPSVTAALLADITSDVGVHERLLAALSRTITEWRRERGELGGDGTLLAVEGHGREDHLLKDVDTARTAGWFTSIYPLRVGTDAASVADTVAQVPNAGHDYGLLGVDAPSPQILFAYLGRVDLGGSHAGPWTLDPDPALHQLLPDPPEPDQVLRFPLEWNTIIAPTPDGPQLMTGIRYATDLFTPADITRLTALWQKALVGRGL